MQQASPFSATRGGDMALPKLLCGGLVIITMEDAMDRSRWRKQIGMIDDHDECEWVNVSSGTGSPGLSRTKSTEP